MSGQDIIDEMVVGQREIMEKRYKNEGVGQEATSDVRIGKGLVTHGVIVKTYDFIDFDLAIQNLLLFSHLLAKRSQPKLTIVIICYCI